MKAVSELGKRGEARGGEGRRGDGMESLGRTESDSWSQIMVGVPLPGFLELVDGFRC